jgi:hypothetical protein
VVSRAVAARLPRCGVIEVDELRHKVLGALVETPRLRLSPQGQEEYLNQWRFAESSAILLANNFADHGYACVIDGLPQRYAVILPDVLESPSSRLVRVALHCSPSALMARRRTRGWEAAPTDDDLRSLAWCRDSQSPVEISVDTGAVNPDSAATFIVAALERVVATATNRSDGDQCH